MSAAAIPQAAPGADAAPLARFAHDWAALSLRVLVHYRTMQALLVSTDGARTSAVWLPASLTIVDEILSPSIWAITIPLWLAKDRGLTEPQPETA